MQADTAAESCSPPGEKPTETHHQSRQLRENLGRTKRPSPRPTRPPWQDCGGSMGGGEPGPNPSRTKPRKRQVRGTCSAASHWRRPAELTPRSNTWAAWHAGRVSEWRMSGRLPDAPGVTSPKTPLTRPVLPKCASASRDWRRWPGSAVCLRPP